jgi:hypothetical protein
MASITAIPLSSVAAELGVSAAQVENVVQLADEGNTVPFITRYRKERTGNLDEEQIRAVLARVAALRQLAERAGTILRLIEAQGKLTLELRQQIERADSLKRLEDLYLPYKPKKQTRAAAARERGLEPLAEAIWSQSLEQNDLASAAAGYVNPEKELPTTSEVLAGAADILAERISEDAEVRAIARRLAWKGGRVVSTATDAAAEKAQAFRDYFNHSEPAAKVPHHRVLAFNRGESEGALRVKFEWDQPVVLAEITRHLQHELHKFAEFLSGCLTDAVDRLIHPSLEREIRRELTERAESQAVSVFAKNLKNLLLQPPLAGRRVLAIDPGFRTGCKIIVLDENGNVVANDLIYCTGAAEKLAATKAKVAGLLQTHAVNLVAIGNGTGCRETEELIAETIAELVPEAQYLIVNEAGASIYSTSTIAREEFPELDATVRGTISIGRRVQLWLRDDSERTRVEAAAGELAAYFQGLIAERRKRLGDDLLSVLIRAEEEGDRLTPEELLVQSIGLLVAGFETTVGLIGLGAKNLIDHPRELAKLRARPELAARAIEECMRFESPVGMTTRVLHADAEFDGRKVAKDTTVWLSIWSSNRDPAKFRDPERFDVERTDNEHVGFGGGTHLCLGAHLARMEAQEALGALAARTKELARKPGRVAWGPSLFRVPAALEVELKPA